MDVTARRPGRLLLAALTVVGLLGAGNALAAVTANPSTVSIFPTETSPPVSLAISFPATTFGGVITVDVIGEPGGVTTSPSPITFGVSTGQTSANVSFRFVAASGTVPGTYGITFRLGPTIGSGGTMSLVIKAPTFTATAIPNPFTTSPGTTRNVTVSTSADPGFQSGLVYSFRNFPAGISFGPDQPVGSPYGPLTFPVSVATSVAPGTYNGLLVGRLAISAALVEKTFPFTIVVQQPDISVSLAQRTMGLCPGAPPASNSVILSPLNGYTGTPRLAFSGIPPGITITPTTTTSPTLPPAQTVPFTVAVSDAAAPGSYPITLTVTDGVFGITKTTTLTVNVQAPDFTASVDPAALSITAGGAPGTLNVGVVANACMSAPITVTPTGAPAGMTFTPAGFTMSPPYSLRSISVQAASAVAGSTYPVTFTFESAGIAIKRVTVPITVVAAGDFTLAVTPALLSLAAGGTSTVTVSVEGLNGFIQPVAITAPAIANITFSPTNFTLLPGSSQVVTVTSLPNAPAGRQTGFFNGTSGALSHRAQLTVDIAAGPDFTLAANPPVLSLVAGTSGTVTVTATGVNGFAGTVSVTAPSLPGLTFTPATFTLPAGGSQTVSVAAAAGAPASQTGNFTGISGALSKTASLTVLVTGAPDFTLSALPSTLTLAPGGSATTTVSVAAVNAFGSPVNVTAPSLAGVSFTPSTFTLSAGGTQVVTVAAASGTAPGTLSGAFTGTSGSLSHTAPITLTVTAAPDFTLSLAPTSLALNAGASGDVVVTANAVNGFSGTISVGSTADPSLSLDPASFTLTPGASRTVHVRAAADATSRTATVVFAGTAAGVTGPRNATLNVAITGATTSGPVITDVVPPSLATGTKSTVLRLLGRNFQEGAAVTSVSPDLVVEKVTFISATVVEVVASVAAEAAAGPYRLDLRNPDGASAPGGVQVPVVSSMSPGAPVSVSSAAIDFPRPGTIVAPGDKVVPKGILATNGTGAIVGTWRLDGVPFDRFHVVAAGGLPVEVRASMPLPMSYAGAHRLELAIETPQSLVSGPVDVIYAAESQSRLRILGPEDGTVVGKEPVKLKWSLVPGASGYEVEFSETKRRPELVFRMEDAEWTPDAKAWKEVGPGEHTWRVRAIFPGEVPGDFTKPRRIVIPPDGVSLRLGLPARDRATGAPVVRWTGGAPGLLYRAQVLRGRKAVYEALAFRPELTLPPALEGQEGLVVRLVAIGPGGDVRGASEAEPIAAPRWSSVHAAALAQQAPGIVTQIPMDATEVETTQPKIAAVFNAPISPPDIHVFLDDVDVTAAARFSETTVVYQPLVPLTPGRHVVKIIAAGVPSGWSFTVSGSAGPGTAEEPAAAPPPPAEGAAVAEAQPNPNQWAVSALGTLTLVEDESLAPGQPPTGNAVRLQVTGQSDLTHGISTGKAAGDLSWRHDLVNPDSTLNESRSWLGKVGLEKDGYRGEAFGGYTPPDFMDQALVLNAGLARGAVGGRLRTPFGGAAYYETFDPKPAGLVSATSGPKQKIRAAAVEAPGNPGRYAFRLIGLRSEDEPGQYSKGGTGDMYGFFGRYSFGQALNAFLEIAHGKYEPNPGGGVDRSGNGYRLGLAGGLGTFTYAANFVKTDEEFVNPANRGFTIGGVPNRTVGDLTLGGSFGRLNVSGQYRHLDGSASNGPTVKQDTGALNVAYQISDRVMASLNGSYTADRGTADPAHYVPETDRDQKTAALTIQENPGSLSLSQMFSYQDVDDSVNPFSAQKVTTATLTAAGPLLPTLQLTGMLSGTRTEGPPEVGKTDQLLVSVQPILAIPSIFLAFTPRASYIRSSAELGDVVTTIEQYQALFQWTPQWVNSLLSLELSADWNRSKISILPEDPGYTRRYAATLTLRWGASSQSLAAAAPAPPQPPAAVNPPSSAPSLVAARRLPL